MVYRKTTPITVSPEVKIIQQELNKALVAAHALVKYDKEKSMLMLDSYDLIDPHHSQILHHRRDVPAAWHYIDVDGKFGNDTENAVKCLQQFLYITENGIMGDTTRNYMKLLLKVDNTVSGRGRPLEKTKKTSVATTATDAIANIFVDFFSFSRDEVMPTSSGITFTVGQGLVLFLEHNPNLHLHIDVNYITNALLHPEKLKSATWFRINNKSFFRHGEGWRTFSVSRTACKWSNTLDGLGTRIGFVGVAIDTIDNIGKLSRGELRFMDVGKYSVNTLSTAVSFAFRNVQTRAIPITRTIANYGSKVAAQWKWAVRIGGSAAAAGTAVVLIQCAGAFLTGWELGRWIDRRFHVGDFIWEHFIGDIAERIIEWNVNRVEVIRFPEDWTEAQIQEFKRQCEKNMAYN